MIKKRIVITALVAMLAASMTVPAYAGAFDVVAGIRSGQYDNTETTKTVNDTVSYPGRIEGTWQQRGADWYYVLPDGSDLKNGYVDGYYMSWTGRMIPGMSRRINVLTFNTVYGGKDPNWYSDIYRDHYTQIWEWEGVVDGLHVYMDTRVGVSAAAYVGEAYQWMDNVAQEAIALSEPERVIYLANVLDSRVDYCIYDDEGVPINSRAVDPHSAASAIVSGTSLCSGFAYAYQALCQRSGLNCEVMYGKDPAGIDHAWNKVTLSDGSICYVDVTYLSATHNSMYASSPIQWEGYIVE